MTKQAINQHVARADALGDDLGRVAGTSLDKGVELDAMLGIVNRPAMYPTTCRLVAGTVMATTEVLWCRPSLSLAARRMSFQPSCATVSKVSGLPLVHRAENSAGRRRRESVAVPAPQEMR